MPSPLLTRPEPEDVRATLAGLTPGWYLALDLHPRYRAVARAAGHTPTTLQHFALGLRRLSPSLEARYAHGHRRAWHITEEWTNPS